MRRLMMLAAAAVLFCAVALTSAPSQAMPLGTGVQGGAETLNPVDKAACWRYGWHGYGWYPCWRGYYPYYGYGYGYGYRPYGYYGGWGWRHRYWGGWGYRHWRHW